MDGWEEHVREHYGDRLEVEEPDNFYRFIWRLMLYGRTIATGETEDEMWEDAFQHICEMQEDDHALNETQGMAT